MLARLVELAIRHRIAVIVVWAFIALAGIFAFLHLPLDAFPDTMPPQVQVHVVAETLTPEEIERQITVPLEQGLANLPGLEEQRSLSRFGFAQLTLQFARDTDLLVARQLVAERLAAVEMPQGVGRPTLGPASSGLGEVFHYLARSDAHSLEELRTLHDRLIAPQLRTVPGVAEVVAWGGAEKQWHVVVDPRRLQTFGLALGDVYQALERNDRNVGGGVVQHGGAAALVLGVGRLADPADIEEVAIATRDGVPILVRDVARVEVGRAIRRGATTADGQGEVVLGLAFSLQGADPYAVTKALAARLEEVKTSLPEGLVVEAVYERTTLVDQVIATVRTNLFEGALLVIAVLFLLLGNLRAGLIVATAIPLSLLFAGTAMARFGIAGTLMSLGAVDFGLLVNSSVILVENAERRLSEAAGARPIAEVVRDATLEVRKPSLFGEGIILLVYLPLLALEGVEGALFRPMAITVMAAIAGSILFSMTLLPALVSFGLGRYRPRTTRVARALERLYRPLLERTLAHPVRTIATALILLAAVGLLATRLGMAFVPRLSEGSIVINTVRLAEIPLEESIRYGDRIEKLLLEEFSDEIDRIWTRTGTAEIATDPMGVELSDVFVELTPRAQWKRARTQAELAAAMEAELADLPGMNFAFLQPIELRTNEMLVGSRADLAVQIFGDDLDLLHAKAREIQAILSGMGGAADVQVEQRTGQPVLRLEIDRHAAARQGVDAADVLDVVAAIGGRQVGELYEGEWRHPIAVRLDDPWRSDPTRLQEVVVPGPDGSSSALGSLVRVRESVGPASIERSLGKRRAVVQVNVRGRDLGSFVENAQRRVQARVDLPPGTWIRWAGQFEHLEQARNRLLVVVPAALALVAALLWFTYRSAIDCLRIFTGIPFAWVGGVLALWARDLPLSIPAAVGFVILSGVAVLDDMVLVSRMRQLLARGTEPVEAIRKAAVSRLRPVIITCVVAALGFLPMATSTGVGAEVQRPLATVVIGGVLSSTVLTLLVLPAISVLIYRRRAPAPLPTALSGGTA